ncbi:hypothetical protein PHMEG_00032224 [Phytophthora megakarya]|uniref:Uncharacterized protein n=1 Tax=Phytophthora megakarya TaxID=4795 RepID=A0A225UW12_9STRA|nr:hypothetical protein PHMEG_00032224 [Phytophthora megakarya]
MSAAKETPVSSPVSASIVASTSESTPVVDSASVPASAHVLTVTPTPLSGTTEKNFSVDKYFELQEKKLELEAKQCAGAAKPDSPKPVFDGSLVLSTDVGSPVDYEDSELEDERRDYYVSLFHELRFLGEAECPEWQALCQSWNQFVTNFNNGPAAYRERIASARERFMRFSKTSVVQRVHEGFVNANIPFLVQCRRVLIARTAPLVRRERPHRCYASSPWWASYAFTISGTSVTRTFRAGPARTTLVPVIPLPFIEQ